MELSWTLLAGLSMAGVLTAFWHASLAAREAANDAARDACERLRLQFLDGTAAFARLRLTRRPDGWLALRRTYVFDYTSDSIARRQGFVVLTGRHVESVGFETETALQGPSRTAGAERQKLHREPRASASEPAPGAGNVLDFERIRQHRTAEMTRRRQDAS